MRLYTKKYSEVANSSNNLRKRLHIRKILDLLDPKPEDRILDVGCNKGELVSVLRNFSSDVRGCDINADTIKSSDVDDLDVLAAENLSYQTNAFDKIICSHVIEHIPQLHKALSEIERVLRPGGLCVLIYPFEIFKGSNCILDAWEVYSDISYCRKLHVRKLHPWKLKEFTRMPIVRKGLFFGPYPTFYSVFQKRVRN